MNKVVILTPTYNRVKLLHILYESLRNQTNIDFTWLIIDDGSTDKTRNFIENLQITSDIDIRYKYQKNKGKAAAMNTGFKLSKEVSMVAIVDSDDYLKSNAVEIFMEYLSKYGEDDTVGGMFFHYINSDTGEVIKPKFGMIESDKIKTRYEYDNSLGKHDGCICYMKRVINEYAYPVVESEKYMGPTVLQLMMSEKYKIVFSSMIVGVAEYQPGGITDSGRKLRMSSPKGMLIYCNLMMDKKSPLLIRLKYAISSWPYAMASGKSVFHIIRESNSPVLLISTYLFGRILYQKWRKHI